MSKPFITKSDRSRYMASREWAVLKRQVRDRSNGICERCKRNPYTQTHHLTYERFGHEELSDLQAQCDGCHDFVSGRSDFDPNTGVIPVDGTAMAFKHYAHNIGKKICLAHNILPEEESRMLQFHCGSILVAYGQCFKSRDLAGVRKLEQLVDDLTSSEVRFSDVLTRIKSVAEPQEA